jgi:hypothetical protein
MLFSPFLLALAWSVMQVNTAVSVSKSWGQYYETFSFGDESNDVVSFCGCRSQRPPTFLTISQQGLSSTKWNIQVESAVLVGS